MSQITIESNFNSLKCTDAKGFYKPFKYPFAYEGYVLQASMHWLPKEVPMTSDVYDWKHKLNPGQKNLLTQLFRFFTTGDIDVGQAYIDKYLVYFKNEEIRMMLSQFAAMEAIHADAYSLLMETVGMPEAEYQAFKQFPAMAAKHDYLMNFNVNNDYEVGRSLAAFSGFTEGLQLFSTFAILMNFARGDLPGGATMKGMNQIVTWSIRDESLHVEYMSKLFKIFIQEHPHVWTEQFKQELYKICDEMIALEDAFIDMAFQIEGIEGITPTEIKQYIRFIGDVRLVGLGLEKRYHVENPLKWLTYMLNGVEHVNFFENRATDYAKGAITGSWADVWAQR